MKILVLAGSPHKKGTSNTLVEEFAKGAKDAGKEVEIIDLAKSNIHPCLGCDHCNMNGDCIQKDDGNEILDKILESNCILFASPVYYYNKSCGTVSMIPKHYYKEAYELGKNI